MAETKWYDRRSDLYHVDPRTIVVVEGWNPRRAESFALDDLMPSIKENGVLIPLRLKRNRDGKLELRDGERRYRAVMQLIDEGVPILTVPCILEKSGNDADLLLNAMLANTGKPFTALEEAEGYRRFLAWGWTLEQLAQRMGKSVGVIRSSLALLDAAPEVVQALQEGTVSRSEAVAVVRQARREETPQAEVLAERQEARRSRPRAEKRVRMAEDASATHEICAVLPQDKVTALCLQIGPDEVINAVITYLRAQEDTQYADLLMTAQDVIAARRD